MKKLTAISLVLVILAGTVFAVNSKPFTDIPDGAWYADDVDYVFTNGLMLGTGDHSFEPELMMDRAMMVTVLYRLSGSPSVEAWTNPFTDVAADAWYADAVIWANAKGVALGTGNHCFSPEVPISREMMVTMFYRLANSENYDTSDKADMERFTDSRDISDYAEEACAWAVTNQIILGMPNDRIAPQETATRAQCAAVIHRLKDWTDEQEESQQPSEEQKPSEEPSEELSENQECPHEWEKVHHPAILHAEITVYCLCGWSETVVTRTYEEGEEEELREEFTSLEIAVWKAHLQNYSPIEAMTEHTSYHTETKVITDQPGYDEWVCKLCGETTLEDPTQP